VSEDPRIAALPDIHGHAKGEHKPFAEERPIPYTARMLFLWFYHACRRGSPRFLMVADHMNYLTFEDPAAVNLVRRALKLAQAGDLYGAAETAGVELGHAAVVSEGLRKGMRYSIGAEIDNDPRCRPDAQNIVDAMKPDGTIRSVHFLPITHPQHGENWMWPFDNPEFKDLYEVVGTEATWDLYMATLLDAIEKLPGNIVGHFYVPAKFGHWPEDAALEGYEDRLLDACSERGMAIEINSRYLYKFYAGDEENAAKFRAVHLRLMRKAKEKGVAIAVGSDAHSPKDQGGAFEEILAMLDEADVNEIAFPIGGRLARVALRATEEILRQHTAALAPPAPATLRVEDPADAEDDDEPAEALPEPEPVVAQAAAPRKKRAPAAQPAESAMEGDPVAAHSVPAEALPHAPPDGEPVSTPVAKKPRPRKTAAPTPAPENGTVELSEDPAEVEAVAAPVPAEADPAPEPVAVAAHSSGHAASGHAVAEEPAAAPVSKPHKSPAPPRAAASKKPPAAKTAAKTSAKSAPAKKSLPKKKAASKKAPAAKPAAKRPAAKKPAAPKAAAGKAASKKTVAKKAAVKKMKIAPKAPAKKAAGKKSAAKKSLAKKPAKRTPAKRTAPARRPPPKKAKKRR
jgi:HisJ family histidinol phosphate phosphatase